MFTQPAHSSQVTPPTVQCSIIYYISALGQVSVFMIDGPDLAAVFDRFLMHVHQNVEC